MLSINYCRWLHLVLYRCRRSQRVGQVVAEERFPRTRLPCSRSLRVKPPKAAVDMARVGLRSMTATCSSPGVGGKSALRGLATPSEVDPFPFKENLDNDTMKLSSERMVSPFDAGLRRRAGLGEHDPTHEEHTPSRPPGATPATKHRTAVTPAMVTSSSGASSPQTSGWESTIARATSAADGGREKGSADDTGGKDHTAPDHWAAPLALFSSNLFFATEGPGRPSGGSDDDDESLGSVRMEDLRDGVEKSADGRRALRNRSGKIALKY